jgi:hypothetical protein
MTEDLRPEAAKRYETEEQELAVLVDGWAEQVVRYREQTGRRRSPVCGGNPDLRNWLDATLYRHREQAYAEGLLAGRPVSTWWDRNWFGVVTLAMMAGTFVLIGLVNGWS